MKTYTTTFGHTLALVARKVIVSGAMLMATASGWAAANPYADPAQPALPASTFQWDLSRTAVVVIDPQVDFMSSKGAGWKIFGESVTEQRLVPNLQRLLAASKRAGVMVAISPHYYYPHDHAWKHAGPAEVVQHSSACSIARELTLDGFRDSGADFVPDSNPTSRMARQ